MSIIDQLEQELNWRESELGSLKLILNSTNTSEQQQRVLLRAAWALLYAHYEGFAKFCLTLFYDHLQRSDINCDSLPRATQVFALSKPLEQIRNKAPDEMLSRIQTFQDDHMVCAPDFPDVDTKSNLWPSILSELLHTADIDNSIINKHEAKIKTLVSRRNEIAHGERNFIKKISYYNSFEYVVYEVMYDLTLAIDEKLCNYRPYRCLTPGP
ncbi:MAG: MAE_28990/MAE_18760 family HEPN-like nuclease [Geminicoccaceae bacterium]